MAKVCRTYYDTKQYGYKILDHSVCSHLLATHQQADHDSLADNYVWTNLELDMLNHALLPYDDFNDVHFCLLDDVLTSQIIPIMRVNQEEYEALENIEANMYAELLEELNTTKLKLRIVYGSLVGTLAGLTGAILWIKLH